MTKHNKYNTKNGKLCKEKQTNKLHSLQSILSMRNENYYSKGTEIKFGIIFEYIFEFKRW